MTALITKRSARFRSIPGPEFFRAIYLLRTPSVRNFLATLQTSLRIAAVFLGIAVSNLPAQIPDTTISSYSLPEFILQEYKFERTGYAVWEADSLPLNSAHNLSDRLLWENVLDVRANAPGTLATISIRGAGPNRTPVFWNGLNLQSPMNGVIDATLIPLWPEDQLEVHFGGQSAAQSSGAMGGSVVVTQDGLVAQEGLSGAFNVAAGSFGRWDGSATGGYSGNRLSSKIRIAHQQADNDFTIQKQGLDGNFYQTRQVNNFLEKTDVQQFNQWKIQDNNTLKTAFWYQNAFREIPPSITEAPRNTWQRDRSCRALATWESAPNTRSLWTTRAAWMEDYLAFHLAGDTDTSRSRQILFSTEHAASFGKQWAWRVGSTLLRQWAQVDGYADSTKWFGQTRVAGFGMGEWHRGKTRFSVLLRQEWAESQAAPFTGSLGAQTGLGRVGETRFHISRNFNLPTLNDRFWKNLGRPDLRPEKGYSADLGWAFRRTRYSIEATGFHLILDDWILWQPDDSGLFRPDNLRKVWSRGGEISGKWKTAILPALPAAKTGSGGVKTASKTAHSWILELGARLQISKTTHVAVYGGSDHVLGKQLPYTPGTSGSLSVKASRGLFSMAYLHQFSGARFDNNEKALQGYQIGNLLGSCSFFQRKLALELRVENIWNARYEIFRYRPMPGRNCRIGLGYRFE